MLAAVFANRSEEQLPLKKGPYNFMTINIILQQRAEQRAGKLRGKGKSQLLRGSRLGEEAPGSCLGAGFFYTSQVQTVAPDGDAKI